MYWALLQAAGQTDVSPIAETLRLGISGGAPIPVDVINQVQSIFNVTIFEGYGLSETASIATFNRPEVPTRLKK